MTCKVHRGTNFPHAEPFYAKTVDEWWEHVVSCELYDWISGKYTVSHIVRTIKELEELTKESAERQRHTSTGP
jgi:hypothetical protein